MAPNFSEDLKIVNEAIEEAEKRHALSEVINRYVNDGYVRARHIRARQRLAYLLTTKQRILARMEKKQYNDNFYMTATGADLDRLAVAIGARKRNPDESDEDYRITLIQFIGQK